MQLTEEKTAIALELHQKLELATQRHEVEFKAKENKIQDQVQDIKNLQYSYETSQMKLDQVEVHHRDLMKEL